MASACDIRLASSDVRFAIKEVDVGLAADIGTLQRGPKVTGNASLFRELALTGRDFGAEEAMRLGFLSRVVQGGKEEVLKEALEVAKIIASKSPVAVIGCVRSRYPYNEGVWNARNKQDQIPAQRFEGPFRARRFTPDRGVEHGSSPSRGASLSLTYNGRSHAEISTGYRLGRQRGSR